MRARVRVLLLVACVALLGSCEPNERRPGLWLRGSVADGPISDYFIVNAIPQIYVETQTWYGIPHSVTTVCAGVGEKLYVPTIYFEGGEWPDKVWNSNVDSDPRVRLKMGGKIFEREAVVVEDPAEVQVALQALAAKYPFWQEQLSKPESERPDMAMVRMDPRGR